MDPGHEHWSIFFWSPLRRRNCSSHGSDPYVVFLRTSFRCSINLLDRSKQSKWIDNLQYSLGLLLSGPCYTSGRSISQFVSRPVSIRYEGWHVVGNLIFCFAHRVANSWRFVEKSRERSETGTVRFLRSATLGGCMSIGGSWDHRHIIHRKLQTT
jgi:hypothetical protein